MIPGVTRTLFTSCERQEAPGDDDPRQRRWARLGPPGLWGEPGQAELFGVQTLGVARPACYHTGTVGLTAMTQPPDPAEPAQAGREPGGPRPEPCAQRVVGAEISAVSIDPQAPPARRTAQHVLAVVVAVLIGALVALAGSSGGLTVSGWPVFALCTVLAYLINWIAFVPAYLRRTERFFDLTGTLTYLAVVALALVAGSGSALSVVLAVVVAVWALRLGTFLVQRIRREGADRRFDQIKSDPGRFLVTWTMQALWVVLTAGAALAAMTSPGDVGIGPVSLLGIVVWLVGFAIEAGADAQKRAFRGDPANRGRFITTGLWAWSRHPNYFGEITLWVGVALIAVPALSGWQYVTLVSPLFVTLLLTRISGIPLLEARGTRTWGDDPDYRDYVTRTPVLVPRPPRHR